NGKLATSVSGDCELSSMTVQLDGKIIAAGTANNSFALVRYNLDGSIDHSFAGGKVFTKISMRMDTVDSVFVDRRGTITAVGTADKNFSAYRAGKKLAAVQY